MEQKEEDLEKPKKPNGFEENPQKPKKADNDNVDEDVIDNDIKKKNTKKNFKKPDIKQIKEYCIQRNNNIDAQYFYDYYESNGWKVGKNTMKDWQATIRTWERRNKSGQSDKEDFLNG